MAYNDILAELRGKLTGSKEEDEKLLKEEGERYAKEGSYDGVKAVGELLLEHMPDGRREEVSRLTHIDGVLLEDYYLDIVKLMDEKNFMEAKVKAEKLYKKILMDYSESDDAVFVSVNNPLEDNLYRLLFPTEKVVNRAPFDFAQYITAYGYILVETGSAFDAIPILEKAIQYNPVDPEPRFELAEVYKLIKNSKQLLQVTRDTMKIAASPVHIARCYANVGYSLTDLGEYEDAVIFYTVSAMFAPNPAIPMELNGLKDRIGHELAVPSRDKVIATMEKYEMPYGPDEKVIAVASQMSIDYLKKGDIRNALQALKITYNLTRDENVRKLILQYQPDAPMAVPGQTGSEEGRPNITRTVNNNPEE